MPRLLSALLRCILLSWKDFLRSQKRSLRRCCLKERVEASSSWRTCLGWVESVSSIRRRRLKNAARRVITEGADQRKVCGILRGGKLEAVRSVSGSSVTSTASSGPRPRQNACTRSQKASFDSFLCKTSASVRLSAECHLTCVPRLQLVPPAVV